MFYAIWAGNHPPTIQLEEKSQKLKDIELLSSPSFVAWASFVMDRPNITRLSQQWPITQKGIIETTDHPTFEGKVLP